MRTLIGIVTFGNLPFTQLTINSLRANTERCSSQWPPNGAVDLFVVVGKPGDLQTPAWLRSQGIQHICHGENKGFPASLNDIYDAAWVDGCYDNLIIMGNDVVPYPGAIDALIDVANTTDWEWVCSSQFDVKSLINHYPAARELFEGENCHFTRWASSEQNGVIEYLPLVTPWEWHADKVPPPIPEGIQPDCIKDVRNLCLFKRSVFEKIGYADVNFWPGGYFEDNDYCTRARKAGVKACGVAHSAYFHFWSRTIHQGNGSTTSRHFQNNARFYEQKWGGGFDHEQHALPFDGNHGYFGPGALKIADRAHEWDRIEYWRGR